VATSGRQWVTLNALLSFGSNSCRRAPAPGFPGEYHELLHPFTTGYGVIKGSHEVTTPATVSGNRVAVADIVSDPLILEAAK